jgi:hypothetical protein
VRLWTGFWFRETDDDVFVLLRTALGLVVLVWAVTLLPDLHDFQGADGLVPERRIRDWQFTFFRWWEGQGPALTLVWIGLVLGGLGMVLGRLVRVATPLAALCLMSLQQDNPIISNAGDDLLRITVVYATVVVVLCRADGVRRPLLGPRVERLRSTMPIWGLRLFQFQLTAIYVATVFKKWPGDTWQDGEAALWALQLVRLERFPVPDLIASSAAAGKAMTWGALGLEILLPLLLWVPRTRRWGIVLGVGMHWSFAYAMRLGVFTTVMTVNYLSFLDARVIRKVLEWRPGGSAQQGLDATEVEPASAGLATTGRADPAPSATG